jgi:alpha-ketoglutarate-dependent taurine dioxygenase
MHPETNQPALTIGRHAYGIPGMEADESEQLLQDLVEHACQAPRTYHHSWKTGDVVLWDNRCLLHQARPWDMSEPRIMYHARIAGDPVTEFAAP